MGLSQEQNPLELFIPGLSPLDSASITARTGAPPDARPAVVPLPFQPLPQPVYNPGSLRTKGNPADPISFLGGYWFIARVNSRCEKRLAEFLFNAGIPYLLPMVAARTSSRNKVLRVLLPGFIFIHGVPLTPLHLASDLAPRISPADFDKINRARLDLATREAADLAAASRYTHGFIWTSNQPRLQNELRVLAAESADSRTLRFEAAVSSRASHPGDPAYTHTHPPKPGSPITILRGPMAGVTGHLLQKKGAASRIVVELQMLGARVSVEIDEADIQYTA